MITQAKFQMSRVVCDQFEHTEHVHLFDNSHLVTNKDILEFQ